MRERERKRQIDKAREWRQAAKRLGERNAVRICCSACKFSVFMEDLEDLLQCISKNVQDTTRGHSMHICICSVKNEIISNAIFTISSFLSECCHEATTQSLQLPQCTLVPDGSLWMRDLRPVQVLGGPCRSCWARMLGHYCPLF